MIILTFLQPAKENTLKSFSIKIKLCYTEDKPSWEQLKNIFMHLTMPNAWKIIPICI